MNRDRQGRIINGPLTSRMIALQLAARNVSIIRWASHGGLFDLVFAVYPLHTRVAVANGLKADECLFVSVLGAGAAAIPLNWEESPRLLAKRLGIEAADVEAIIALDHLVGCVGKEYSDHLVQMLLAEEKAADENA